jgi:hypothetical protein
MSIQVLSVRPGRHFNHTFLDDLESFFWLILWSVAAHLDPGEEPTDDALRTLQALDRPDLEDMAGRKMRLLRECGYDNGEDMMNRLRLFNNTWASDPAVVSTTISLGRFFHMIDARTISNKQLPAAVFPYIVSIILDALGEPLPDDFSNYRDTHFS